MSEQTLEMKKNIMLQNCNTFILQSAYKKFLKTSVFEQVNVRKRNSQILDMLKQIHPNIQNSVKINDSVFQYKAAENLRGADY